MKNKLCTLLLLTVLLRLDAQITVTNATFPVAGDTLKTITSFSPSGVVISPPGGPYEWNFGTTGSNVQQQVVYRPASEGSAAADVPQAELFVDFGNQSEGYYNVTAGSFETIAAKGPDPAGLGLVTLVHITPPIPERRAPLTFIATFASTSNLLIPVSTEMIPDEFLDSLGIPFVPDSLRVRVTSTRTDLVDAYGNLTIPGGTYPVLRERRTEYRETRLDALLPLIGWSDITDLLLANFSDLGTDTLQTYYFWSNTEKEAIAEVRVDNATGQPQYLEMKDNGVLSSAGEPAVAAVSVIVSPNPTSGVARFELKNHRPGHYTLYLTDERGALVSLKKISVTGDATESVSLAHLPAGMYFFRLVNETGSPVATGKLVKTDR